MKRIFVIQLASLSLSLVALTGCRRGDPRQNSNPHPEGASQENHPAEPRPAPAPKADAKTGTDSTGRPSDASGGTTGRKSP